MSSYYDDELALYMESLEIKDVTIISQPNSIVELIMKKFHFKNGRVYFSDMNNKKYVKSSSCNISSDVILLINELIKENAIKRNEKIIYVGDNLTENGYELYLHDLTRIIPFLVNDIPQHHYFLFSDATKLMYVSFENEIFFGICS